MKLKLIIYSICLLHILTSSDWSGPKRAGSPCCQQSVRVWGRRRDNQGLLPFRQNPSDRMGTAGHGYPLLSLHILYPKWVCDHRHLCGRQSTGLYLGHRGWRHHDLLGEHHPIPFRQEGEGRAQIPLCCPSSQWIRWFGNGFWQPYWHYKNPLYRQWPGHLSGGWIFPGKR